MKINLTHTTATIILLFLTLGATQIGNAQTPNWQWGKRGGSPGSVLGNDDNVVDMATDQHGNVYVLGENKTGTISNVDGHPGIGIYDCASVASWDCNGNFRWKKTYGGGPFGLFIPLTQLAEKTSFKKIFLKYFHIQSSNPSRRVRQLKFVLRSTSLSICSTQKNVVLLRK